MGLMDNVLIYENKLYSVYHGDAQVSEHPLPLYKVISKTYEVIELETTVLMRALFNADDMEAHVMAHMDMQKQKDTSGDGEGLILS